MIFTYYFENIAVKIEEKVNAIPLGKRMGYFSIKINCNKSGLIKRINLILKVKLDANMMLNLNYLLIWIR